MNRFIEMDNVSYEIHRVFSGSQPVAALLERRILRENRKMTPLTQRPAAAYTDLSSVVSQKEV